MLKNKTFLTSQKQENRKFVLDKLPERQISLFNDLEDNAENARGWLLEAWDAEVVVKDAQSRKLAGDFKEDIGMIKN